MFGYLRYFSIFSMFAVIIAAYFVGTYFKSLASEDLSYLVQNNNKALAQGYINSVWKEHHSVLERLYRIDIGQWNKYREFQEFKKDTLKYFEDMPVADLAIYTMDMDIFIHKNKLSGSKLPTIDRETSKQIRAGKVTNRILHNHSYIQANGIEKEGTLIQTFIPIYSDYYVAALADNGDNPKIEAVIELHYNVTEQWNNLFVFQLITIAGIVLIFVILIVVLIISSRRAETIIGKQHEINLELTAAAAAAEAENRDKSQFLANISHELRTPLNAIIGFSEIIKTESITDLSETHQEYIKDIHSSGVHLLSLINDILDYSKAEAGKLEVSVGEIDAIKLIKNSMRLVIPRAEQAQVTLIEDVPNKHFTVQTDAKKLKQVLLNLLSNAVKFTPAGGQVKVSAWHNKMNDTVVFKVSDSGIGIAHKDISRVMMPFGQVDSTLARKYEGTGLGLPLSKKFVEILGGHFSIESNEGEGTTITITLPQLFDRDSAGR